MKPIGNRILVEPITDKESNNGIIIPDKYRKMCNIAKVLELGTGEINENGKLIPFQVKVGDTVILEPSAWAEIQSNNKIFKVFNASDVLGVIEE